MKKALLHKIGEVNAFSEYGRDFFKKNGKPLKEAFKAAELKNIVQKNQAFSAALLKMVKGKDAQEVLKKSKKSLQKFKAMEKIYLEGSKESTELLEWLSFFEGSAMVHWYLVHDMAQEEQKKDLQKMASEGEKFHHKILHTILDRVSETED